MRLLHYLIEDHKKIRSLSVNLASDKISSLEKSAIFHELSDLLHLHFEAEEIALYSQCRKLKEYPISAIVREHYRDHFSILNFLDKIKRTHKESEKELRFKTLCDFIDNHLDTEEEELFPYAKTSLTKYELNLAANKYLSLRSSNGDQERARDYMRSLAYLDNEFGPIII